MGTCTAKAAPTFNWLGDLAGGIFSSRAYAVSADGSIVVSHDISASGPDAFIWKSTNSFRLLEDVLVNGYGLCLGGSSIRLVEARGISGDGQVITGYGTTALGNTEAWVVSLRGAQVSEPGVLVSLGLGALLMSGAMRRRHGAVHLPQRENLASGCIGG